MKSPAQFVTDVGDIGLLTAKTTRNLFRRPFGWRDVVLQLERIGYDSLPVVALTAIFSSMVMAVQFGVQMGRFGAKAYVANVVSLSLTRELGPVLTALMVGGRVGAGITAEIGSMNVNEQIDAMRAMGADPVRKLVVPRVIAGVLALPLLTMLANVLGIIGAMLMEWLKDDIRPAFFWSAVQGAITVGDLTGGLIKTLFFGFFITLIACHKGLTTRGGTQGVGRAVTETVVVTSIVTLISDFILTSVLLSFGL